MHLNATNAAEYLQSQLDDMGFDEKRRLAGFLEENELHLAEVVKVIETKSQENNDANLDTVDACSRADACDERMRKIYEILNNIYG